MKKFFFQNLLLVSAMLLAFVSCQKELSDGINPSGNTTVDLGSKVRSNVSGFVTDENENPVQGASVKVGTQTITTDEYGYFEAKNVEVSKNAATVNVNKPGYFPGIRTYLATNNKAAFVRIKLLPKDNAGTIAAATGGTVTLTNGLKINLPANAVVNAATGAAYTGTVNVAAKWLDPTAADIDRIMPGDLRAIDENNSMKLLQTYGMAAVELTGGSGEKLQVATGKKARLTLPLPASIAGTAPSSIPLWHFDEAIGLWKEEGSATKVGNTYEGEVSHFSFWNCDVPMNYIQLDMTVKDPSNNPIRYAYVKVTNTSNNTWAAGFTDSAGYVKGAVPANTQLRVDVYSAHGCNTPLHTQNVTAGNTDISLGTVNISNISSVAYFSGTVTNCSNAPVTHGKLIVKYDSYYTWYWVNPDGTFNLNANLCNVASLPITIIAEDMTAGQQSAPATFTLAPGNNALGNLQACGTTTDQFLNMSINGTPHNFTQAADSLSYSNNNQTTCSIWAMRGGTPSGGAQVNIIFSNTGLGVGSSQAIIEFNTDLIPAAVLSTGTTISITEYGAVGEFIAGTFTTTKTGTAAPNTVYTITGSFRIRRYN